MLEQSDHEKTNHPCNSLADSDVCRYPGNRAEQPNSLVGILDWVWCRNLAGQFRDFGNRTADGGIDG